MLHGPGLTRVRVHSPGTLAALPCPGGPAVVRGELSMVESLDAEWQRGQLQRCKLKGELYYKPASWDQPGPRRGATWGFILTTWGFILQNAPNLKTVFQ